MTHEYMWHNKIRYARIYVDLAKKKGLDYSIKEAAEIYDRLCADPEASEVNDLAKEAWTYMTTNVNAHTVIKEKLVLIDRLVNDIKLLLED